MKKQANSPQLEARSSSHKIQWLNLPGYKGETWNPLIGCFKVSAGCKNCYALKMATRIAGIERAAGRINYRATLMPDKNNIQNEWNGFSFLVNEALPKPKQWKKPRVIFVCSMGDLFYEGHLYEWIDAVFSVMSDCDQHIYIVLTKRPEQMVKFYEWKKQQHGIPWRPKDNVWMGVTAENQEQANNRIPYLLQVPAAVRFVSIEPMMGPVDLSQGFDYENEIAINFLTGDYITNPHQEEATHSDDKLHWVICGGESGHHARPMHPDWVRSIRNQCKEAKVPFFFKQWGEWLPVNQNNGDETKLVNKQNIISMSNHGDSGPLLETSYMVDSRNYLTICKVGKHKSGNLLDGVKHEEYPKIK